MVDINTAFVLFASVIFIGFVSLKLFERFKIPDLIILMLFGLAIGPIFGVVGPDSISNIRGLSSLVGTLVLIILLLEGGTSLNYRKVMKEAAPATLFTVLVFVGSVAAVSLVSLAFGWKLINGLILGAILGGTSSTIIFSLVKKMKIKEGTKIILGLESSINDALTIVSVIALIEIAKNGTIPSIGSIANTFLGAFSISAMVAVIVGVLWIKALDLLHTKRYKYLLTLATALVLYVFVESVKSNGAFAVLVFGIIIGNAAAFGKILRTKNGVSVFSSIEFAQEEMAFFVRTFFFVFMGLIINISAVSWIVVAFAAAIIASKVFARYVSVGLMARIKPSFSTDRAILTNMLPNGLAAAAMASYPIVAGVGTSIYVEVAFLVILLSNIYTSISVFFVERNTHKSSSLESVDDKK